MIAVCRILKCLTTLSKLDASVEGWSNSKDKSGDTEACRVLQAMVWRRSTGNHSTNSVEVPFWDLGRITPLVFFFQPSNSPVIDMKKKNINSNAPVVLWIFLKIRNTLACFFLLPMLMSTIDIKQSHKDQQNYGESAEEGLRKTLITEQRISNKFFITKMYNSILLKTKF